jgi:hypothetical protein
LVGQEGQEKGRKTGGNPIHTLTLAVDQPLGVDQRS